MGEVRLERSGPVATITIDRPASRNALNQAAMARLDSALRQVADWAVHAVFLRGAGDRAFIAGGDVKELESNRDAAFALDMARRMRSTLDLIPALPMPVVAVVNGPAIGGGAEVAVACDYRLAVADARIGFTQARLGLMPAWGGIERLGALVGRGQALLLLTTGRELDAAEAQRIGLFEELVARADLESRLQDLAGQLAAVPRSALAGIKRALEAAQPYARPELAAAATADFAGTWADPAHWEALEKRRSVR